MPSMSPWAAPVAVGVSVALLASCGLGREPQRTLVRSEDDSVMVIDDPRIDESSGLAASAVHPGVLYTHNDKGAGPEVFAVGEDGSVRATIQLEGAPAADWEDIAVTPDGQVWVADIGGVSEGRSTVSVIRFEEPTTLADGPAPWTSFRLVYPDGAHDAEALLVDPRDQRLYVVTKDSPEGGIYAAPTTLRDGGTHALERIGSAPPNITGGSFAPSGEQLALRDSNRAFLLDGIDDTDPLLVNLPQSRRGESIVLLEDGEILVGSEGASSEVVRVRVPDKDQRG